MSADRTTRVDDAAEWRPKRQKTTHDSSSGTRKRARKTLSDLPEMPIDILFEIFSMLTPKDLLNLTRTTKSFRRLLLSRRSTTVWKSARLSMLRPLECPPDVSEPYWANLVYGGNECGNCGYLANAKRLFFELRRRVCVDCFEKCCVTPPKDKKEKPKFDLAALELIPYVNYRVGRCKLRPYFWKAEVKEVARELQRLRNNVAQNKPDAAKALEDYKRIRSARTLAILQHAAECYAAVQRAIFERPNDLQDMRRQRYNRVCANFVERGFEEDEVKAIVKVEAMISAPLTPRAWQAIKKKYLPLLEDHRKRQLKALRRSARAARLVIMRHFYEAYLKGRTPLQKLCLPRVQHAYNFPKFRALLETDPSVKLPHAEFAGHVLDIPNAVADWEAARDAMLLQLMERTPDAPQPTEFAATVPASDWSSLELATFVTMCTHNSHSPGASIAIGRREVVMHAMHDVLGPEPPRGPCVLDVSCLHHLPAAAAAAAELVRLVGLDEMVATPTQMDTADARFLCDICCPVQESDGMYLFLAMDWRQCLEHFLNEHQHSAPQWRVLDESQRAVVAELEELSNVTRERMWACNHCSGSEQPLYLDRSDVVRHLAESHGTVDPVDDQDLFILPSIA